MDNLTINNDQFEKFSDTFQDAFKQAELPYKLFDGEREFTEGNLTVKIDFNPEYFNFFPRITFEAFGNEMLRFGAGFGERRYYTEEITEDNLKEALKDAQNLVSDVRSYALNVDLNDFDEEEVKSELIATCASHKFGTAE